MGSTLRLVNMLVRDGRIPILVLSRLLLSKHLLDLLSFNLEIRLLKDFSSFEDEGRSNEILVTDAKERLKLKDLKELLVFTLQPDKSVVLSSYVHTQLFVF